MSAPPPPKGSPSLWLALAAACASVAVAAFLLLRPAPIAETGGDAPVPEAAVARNAVGVGHLEQFEYARAAAEFEAAYALAPEWTPARINLGIALLNTAEEKNLDRAIGVFEGVLKANPDSRHAHYCLGIIYLYRNRIELAGPRFQAVTRLDPEDAHAWYHLGRTHPKGDDSPEAKGCFERALKLNPYLNAARYALAMHPFERDEAKTKALLAEQQQLVAANWEKEYRIAYMDMGPYAEAIGREPGASSRPAPTQMPLFAPPDGAGVTLAPGTRWATDADLAAAPGGALLLAARGRFGGAMTLFDYDGDGQLDVLLSAAVFEGGAVRDALFRNGGAGKFVDVSAQAKLSPVASVGALAASLDNDPRPDILRLLPTGVRLERNAGGTFADITAASGLGEIRGAFVGCLAADLDQDGDLDLLPARYAGDAEAGAKALSGGPAAAGGGLTPLLNAGVAPPAPPGTPAPPLELRFRPLAAESELNVVGPVVAALASDLDSDADLDAVVLIDGRPPLVVRNDRLLRFTRRGQLTFEGVTWAGGAALRALGPDRSDLLLLGKTRPVLMSLRDPRPSADAGDWYTPSAPSLPTLTQASLSDVDADGYADIVGRTPDGKAALIRARPPALRATDDPFGTASSPAELLGVVAADLTGDGRPDFLGWSRSSGLLLHESRGNDGRVVRLALTGQRDAGTNRRTNADAIGALVRLHAAGREAAWENVSQSAGPGQSRGPLEIGVGPAPRVEALRVRWPDQVVQAELDVPADGTLIKVTETNRKGTSCPVLYTWDGAKWAYLTDCLGAGALDEAGPDGAIRPARPFESVHVPAGRLAPVAGTLKLRIGEPMDEMLYLDRVELEACDHPPGVVVFPDERFAAGGPPATGDPLAARDARHPAVAADHRNRDVRPLVTARDERMACDFLRRSWLGYAEDHWLELTWDAVPEPGREQVLILAGGVDYPYPESIFAATQAGVDMVPPALERRKPDGTWESLADLGFPAGLTRTMVRRLSPGTIRAGDRVRIRTNLQVYWDEVRLAGVLTPAEFARDITVHRLAPTAATLDRPGFAREVLGVGSPLVGYDRAAKEPVAASPWPGPRTPPGDVLPLVTANEGRFALCGPGEEIELTFPEPPAVTPGRERATAVRLWGYCKDTSPFTVSGGRVEPLPGAGRE